MLIRAGYEIRFELPQPSPILLMLYLHPSRQATTRRSDHLRVLPGAPITEYIDSYGNRCGRVVASAGTLSLINEIEVNDSGLPDLFAPTAMQHPVQELPNEVLLFLLSSRYCEVDSDLKDIAWSLFGRTAPGWLRVQAICDFVHHHIRFDYMLARATRTALDAYRERVGVCRDFMHLAITFCRCCNIPARYCTGYLGDIGVPAADAPMDFSAWFEVYLDGQWYAFDARNNAPRIGRVLMARGRDAADVALTTIFGENRLQFFRVWTDEVGTNS
ncbi:transglutaminase-like domain-containing protein [Pirellulaceae bacterium SH501]